MKLDIIFTILSLVSFVVALGKQDGGGDGSTTTTAKPTPTSVYVTITTNGKVTVIQTEYKQTFMSTFSDNQHSVPAGNVGLGSLSGSVGGVRSYQQTTVGNGGSERTYGGALGVVCLVLGMI